MNDLIRPALLALGVAGVLILPIALFTNWKTTMMLRLAAATIGGSFITAGILDPSSLPPFFWETARMLMIPLPAIMIGQILLEFFDIAIDWLDRP